MEPIVLRLRLSSPGLHEFPDHLISEVAVRDSHLEIVSSQSLHLPLQSWRPAGRLRLGGNINPQSSLVVLALHALHALHAPLGLLSARISFY